MQIENEGQGFPGDEFERISALIEELDERMYRWRIGNGAGNLRQQRRIGIRRGIKRAAIGRRRDIGDRAQQDAALPPSRRSGYSIEFLFGDVAKVVVEKQADDDKVRIKLDAFVLVEREVVVGVVTRHPGVDHSDPGVLRLGVPQSLQLCAHRRLLFHQSALNDGVTEKQNAILACRLAHGKIGPAKTECIGTVFHPLIGPAVAGHEFVLEAGNRRCSDEALRIVCTQIVFSRQY